MLGSDEVAWTAEHTARLGYPLSALPALRRGRDWPQVTSLDVAHLGLKGRYTPSRG